MSRADRLQVPTHYFSQLYRAILLLLLRLLFIMILTKSTFLWSLAKLMNHNSFRL